MYLPVRKIYKGGVRDKYEVCSEAPESYFSNLKFTIKIVRSTLELHKFFFFKLKVHKTIFFELKTHNQDCNMPMGRRHKIRYNPTTAGTQKATKNLEKIPEKSFTAWNVGLA